MRLKNLYLLVTLIFLTSGKLVSADKGKKIPYSDIYLDIPLMAADTTPIEDRYGDFLNFQNRNPFDLQDPSVVKKEVTYDPETNQYILTEKMGDEHYRAPTYMTFEEYMEYSRKNQESSYFEALSSDRGNRSISGIIDPLSKFNVQDNLVDRLFGGTKVDIRPQGEIGLTFGWKYTRTEDPGYTLGQQRNGAFNFDMNINMSVQGKIGEKLNLNFDYNSKPTFDFDNQMKIQYDPTEFSEDDIIQNIEAGDVTLPLQGTLIQGAQSLFGLRLDTKWGALNLSTIIAQQKSDRNNLTVQGGAQYQEYEVFADDYEENRHFFISHYNRNTFENSLEKLPVINNVFKLERIQVFITGERSRDGELVDIVAFSDLGEGERLTDPGIRVNPSADRDFFNDEVLPDNSANDLFEDLTSNPATRVIDNVVTTLQRAPFNMQQGKDFEKVTARPLREGREYTIHPELGFLSIGVPVQPDHTIGISFQYSYNGEIYQVGEFSNKVPASEFGQTTSRNNNPTNPQDTLRTDTSVIQTVVFTKMLKSATQRVDIPLWDLMMKNIYNIGAYNVNPDDFEFGVFYDEPGIGYKQFLPRETGAFETPLINLFNLDNLNSQLDPCPDGEFDFVPGVTIQPRNGRIMFPTLEPFGDSIASFFPDETKSLGSKYSYQVLYDSTVTRAREYPDKNRFLMKGLYKSEVSSEIILNAINIPRGALAVTAGGKRLVEGVDYEVDYSIGRLRILNDAYISSGVPINVSFEDRSLFGFQQKSMIGLRADYAVNKNLTVGGTYMHLFERPFTQKVNVGDDPINNRVVGLDMAWSKDAPFITKMVDALPFLDTKAESSVNFTAEAAAFFPGHSRAINQGGDDANNGGIVLIDDFDGSFPEISLSAAAAQEWNLASIPQNDADNNNPLFKESDQQGVLSGVNRARFNWFLVDERARNGSDRDPYTDQVEATEVFRQSQQQSFQNIRRPIVFHFDPTERGPYNFDEPDGTSYSDGIDFDGNLISPASRWGGVTRQIQNNDFEANNVEFVEFWLLSPYLDPEVPGQISPNASQQQGDIYINLGNVSEDILKDSRLSYENGLPANSPTSQNRRTSDTPWGKVPASRPINKAFDTDQNTRSEQDIGLDGISDADEQNQWSDYLSKLQGRIKPAVIPEFQADPANDNFEFFTSPNIPDSTRVVEKYANFNNPEGNSPINTGNTTTQSARLQPDSEDLNDDKTLNEAESYFQYKLPIRFDGSGMQPEIAAHPFINDTVQVLNQVGDIYRLWYNVKIPISAFESAVGGIQDFRSIRFIRMFMTGFEAPTTFAMIDLKLTRSNWRKYRRSLKESGGLPDDLYPPVDFQLADVNVEENSTKVPFPYLLPEGIIRERTVGGLNANLLQNESSIALTINDLTDGDARGIYRLTRPDLRFYEKVKMFVHAEPTEFDPSVRDGDLSIFMRLGSDFENNYYEYEIPLEYSRDDDLPDNELAAEIWKENNTFDFAVERLTELKQRRNKNNISNNQIYEDIDPDYALADPNDPMHKTIKVKGNPDLGQLAGIMIGVRNKLNDGVPHSAEIWVNELSATGLNEQGGVAALGRLDVNLADFGQLTVAGNYSGIGYGGVDQNLLLRNQDETVQYDFTGSAELGKFFGEKSGIKIPVLAQYSQGVKTPKFDPNSGDIKMKDLLADPDLVNRDSVKRAAQIRSTIKTVSVTNLRKDRMNNERKPMPWDIANWSASYNYTDKNETDPKTELARTQDHYGSIDYGYTAPKMNIRPFKKLIKKDKYLKLFSQFNFNPLPQNFTFASTFDKDLHQTKRRFAGDNELFNTFYEKKFLWDRDYNLAWDFTKALKFNFIASNFSIIDELKNYDDEGVERSKSELAAHNWEQIQKLGRTRNYDHKATASYQLPFKLIPFLDFINARAQYNITYDWTGASLNALELGNIIRNTQKRDISGDLNFEKLYNKSPYLKKINRKSRSSRGRNKKAKSSADNRGKKEEIDKENGKKKKKKSGPSLAERALVRPLLLFRNARFRYSEDFETVVPGFTPQSKLFGLSEGFGAPGWEFAAGWQPDNNWFDRSIDSNDPWITDAFILNQKVQQKYSQTLDGKLTIEPIPDFRINLDLRRKYTENHTEVLKNFSNDPNVVEYDRRLPQDMGTLDLTYFSANTLFGQDIDGIELFELFEANRSIISQRIGAAGTVHSEDDQTAYTEGYGRLHQDVILPAFVAAYSGKDANTIGLDIFNTTPLPNWSADYSGLSKLGFMKDIFQKINIKHGYKSSMRISQFQTDLNYDPSAPTGLPNVNPETKNYYSRFEIPNVVIDEGFSPLLDITVELKNGMSTSFGMSKNRNLQMNLFTYQLTETKDTKYNAGFEYTMQDVQFGWLRSKKKKSKKKEDPKDKKKKNLGNQFLGRTGGGGGNPQDLTFNFKAEVNDGITINHFLDQDIHERIRGEWQLILDPSIDYQYNSRLQLSLYTKYRRTVPKTSLRAPSTNSEGGLKILFQLN